MYRIGIVEDDEKLRKELEIFLNHNGYEAIGFCDFEDCVPKILALKSDLILLDINLPLQDGESICREIRKVSNVPIIMITSRDNDLDELISMNYGADDYVTKPFHTQILLAHIASILKRVYQKEENKNQIDGGNFILNLSESKLVKGNQQVELTKNEMKILHCLLNARNTIVSREKIMDYLWSTDEFIDDNTLTVNIARVRNKLEEIGLKEILETKRGQGYCLREK